MPEIAAVMLVSPAGQASLLRPWKIVEVPSMVRMALYKLSEEEIVELDEDKHSAAMVSNVCSSCADEAVQLVVNTGTLEFTQIKQKVRR